MANQYKLQTRRFFLTLDYKAEYKRENGKEMKKDIDKFLGAMRREHKKAGKVFKYIHVMEIGPKGAKHHHLVIQKTDTEIIRKHWPYGWIKVKPLDETGQYKKLAAYLIKYSEKTLKTEGRLQGRRWNPSRNLEQPQIKKKVVKERKGFRAEAKERKGYYVDKETVREGIHEVTGYPFFTYTLIKNVDKEWMKQQEAG